MSTRTTVRSVSVELIDIIFLFPWPSVLARTVPPQKENI